MTLSVGVARGFIDWQKADNEIMISLKVL